MAGEILYFLHRHFRAVLVLGMFVSLGLLGAFVKAAVHLFHVSL